MSEKSKFAADSLKHIWLLAGVVILLLVTDVQGSCWQDAGKKEQAGFGSDEQVKELQALMNRERNCSSIGISWRIELKTGLVLDNALIYDREAKRLWRIKIENIRDVYKDISWLGWTRVTDERILALEPSSGFELDGQHSGKGVPLLDTKAKDLLKNEAPKKLSGALLKQ